MESLPVPRPKVFEPDLAPRSGDADLPSVQMTGENQVEFTRPEPAHNVRKMAQQDPEVGPRVREATGPNTATKRDGIDSDDLEPCCADLERTGRAGVENGSGALDIGWIGGLVERVTSPSQVVVSEYCVDAVWGGERTECAAKLRSPSPPADQVPRDGDEVRVLLPPPIHRLAKRPLAQRKRAEVEV